MYLDLRANPTPNGGNHLNPSVLMDDDASRATTKLSRMVKSDPIPESECYEGYLEKKSPKFMVGW
jgi:hypothetical protein